MKITVIGYWGAYPAANEATSGYLLETDQHRLLIDCGSGVLSKLQHYINVETIDALILSHFHTDHTADVYALQHAMLVQTQLGKREKPLPIYALQDDADHLQEFERLSYHSFTKGYSLTPQSVLTFGNVKVSFVSTTHPRPCLGMRFDHKNGGSIAYTADTEWSDTLLQLADNVDLLICESSLYAEQKGQIPGHLTAAEAGLLARHAQVKRLCLTHLPHYGDHQQLLQEAKQEFQGKIALAETGKRWEI